MHGQISFTLFQTFIFLHVFDLAYFTVFPDIFGEPGCYLFNHNGVFKGTDFVPFHFLSFLKQPTRAFVILLSALFGCFDSSFLTASFR